MQSFAANVAASFKLSSFAANMALSCSYRAIAIQLQLRARARCKISYSFAREAHHCCILLSQPLACGAKYRYFLHWSIQLQLHSYIAMPLYCYIAMQLYSCIAIQLQLRAGTRCKISYSFAREAQMSTNSRSLLLGGDPKELCPLQLYS